MILIIPHSHTWFWTQTCIAGLLRFPPIASGIDTKVVLVDNSPWSPAIRGISDTSLANKFSEILHGEIITNQKPEKYHASALDFVIENYDADYYFTWETDVLPLSSNWLEWFMAKLNNEDHANSERHFAIGHWHHEQFINPSCTLYTAEPLRRMLAWCKENKEPLMRWGAKFEQVVPMEPNQFLSMGPFAEKRGWPQNTILRRQPTGQCKGPGWYEPGQAFFHWAVEHEYYFLVCPTETYEKAPGLPVHTVYGPTRPIDREFEYHELTGFGYTVHLWGGTRALDILKHQVECQFVKKYTPYWLQREAKYWQTIVPPEVQIETFKLIPKYRWHYRGAGTPDITDRDREAVAFVEKIYNFTGIQI